MKSRPRKTVDLSHEVYQQLNKYALAATATAVGMLALAPSSEAKIVYTPAHVIMGNDQGYWLDLNHDGIPDFSFFNWLACTEYCWNSLYVVSPIKGKNDVEAAPGRSFTYAYALKPGVAIDSKGRFTWFALMVNGSNGPWFNVTRRYLGLKFQVRGKTHYGWARLSVHGTYGHVTATLTGYAYETIPNKPIIAGKMTDAEEIESSHKLPASANEPNVKRATLGSLALGWHGLLIWRRRESLQSPQ